MSKKTETLEETRTTITCAVSGQSVEVKVGKKGPVLPRGWRKHPDGRLLGPNAMDGYRLSAETFVVAGPVDSTWEELRAALKATFAQTTEVAGWAQLELLKAEKVRSPEDKKIWPAPSIYLYGMANEQGIGQGISGASRQAIFRSVQQKWNARRYEVLWVKTANPPYYKYPQPLPVPSQAWKASLGPDNQMLFQCRIGDQKFVLRLRSGQQWFRQKERFRQIVSGDAMPGEALLVLQPTSRGGMDRAKTKANGGGQKQQNNLVVKIVGYFPIDPNRQNLRSGSLYLSTFSEGFIKTIPNGDEETWLLHADHVERWIVEHRQMLDRLSCDEKWERRRPKRQKMPINEYRERICQKQHNRLQTWAHESTRMIANFAARQKKSEVVLNTNCRDWCQGQFPWYAWTDTLNRKLLEHGIALKDVTVKDETSSTVVE